LNKAQKNPNLSRKTDCTAYSQFGLTGLGGDRFMLCSITAKIL
jgi:hypothetical protein